MLFIHSSSVILFFCFLMLFNITFSSSVIEIYKKKKKTLLKSYYFYLETKMRMQKSEIFMGFTFIICIIIKFFFGVLSEIR